LALAAGKETVEQTEFGKMLIRPPAQQSKMHDALYLGSPHDGLLVERLDSLGWWQGGPR
jgi:hypothetical protein